MIISIPPEDDELMEIDNETLDAIVIIDIAEKVEVISVDNESDKTDMPSTSEKNTWKLKTEKPKSGKQKHLSYTKWSKAEENYKDYFMLLETDSGNVSLVDKF